VTTTSGVVGVLILIAATTKINDWNLYSGSLGLANFLDTAFGKKIHRALLTLIVGIVGTVLSALGILTHFVNFLTILGVAIPPVAAIIVVDYFVLKTHRQALAAARRSSRLPAWCPNWNTAGWVAWIAAALVGYYVHWGIASVNSLVVAAILYYGLARLMPVKTPAAAVTEA
jgi:cytosine permease